jgi:hypothetical protein
MNSRVPSGSTGASFFESVPTPGFERTSNRSDTVTAIESGARRGSVGMLGEAGLVGSASADGWDVAIADVADVADAVDALGPASDSADEDGLDSTGPGVQPMTEAMITPVTIHAADFMLCMPSP